MPRHPYTLCKHIVSAAPKRYRPAWPGPRKTASSMTSVTRPVKVFCWLGW